MNELLYVCLRSKCHVCSLHHNTSIQQCEHNWQKCIRLKTRCMMSPHLTPMLSSSLAKPQLCDSWDCVCLLLKSMWYMSWAEHITVLWLLGLWIFLLVRALWFISLAECDIVQWFLGFEVVFLFCYGIEGIVFSFCCLRLCDAFPGQNISQFCDSWGCMFPVLFKSSVIHFLGKMYHSFVISGIVCFFFHHLQSLWYISQASDSWDCVFFLCYLTVLWYIWWARGITVLWFVGFVWLVALSELEGLVDNNQHIWYTFEWALVSLDTNFAVLCAPLCFRVLHGTCL